MGTPNLRVVSNENHNNNETLEKSQIWKVITASSAGTLIEWYDFYIFGSLATIIAAQFFPKGNDTVEVKEK